MDKVVMIEAGAKEIPDEIMYEGIVKAHEEIRRQVEFINGIVAEIGKPKFEYQHASFNQELFDDIVANFMDEAKAAMDTDDKNVREQRWNAMIDHWHVWTAVPRTRSVLWPPRWAFCPVSTALASLPVVRLRCCPCVP